MDDSELEAMMRDLESDRVERKESLSSANTRDEVARAVCAFANDLPGHRKPGVVMIGVRDDGTGAGKPVTEQVLQTLADIRSAGNVLPPPGMVVEKRMLAGCDVAVALVQPSDAPPVRFKGQTWVRVGPRRAVATLEEERRLNERRRGRDLPYELQPLPLATLEDLDLELFRTTYLPQSVAPEVLAENHRSVEQQLASLRLASAEAPVCPTVLGVLAVGKDPRRLIGGAYVQFLRMDGTELSDSIVDAKELGGAVPYLLFALDELLKLNITTATEIGTGPVDSRTPDYPLAALQQIVRNAVLHRNYEHTNAPVRITWYRDRIEVHNPGGPYGQVTKQNFGQPNATDYRNRNLAEVMRNLGFIQRFGVGIAIARREMERNGNPSPEFQVEDTSVLCVLRRRHDDSGNRLQ